MQFESLTGLQAQAEQALSAGQIVVVFAHCEGTVEHARARARQLGDWLAPFGPYPAGGVSRSATRGLAALAACRGGPVGVDVEVISGAALRSEEVDYFMHASESALYRPCGETEGALAVWARKEAMLKAFGTGLALSPASLQVGLHDDTWADVVHPLLGAAQVVSLPAPQGYVAAAATRARPAPPICLIDASPLPVRAR